MLSFRSSQSKALTGNIEIPGDKSISHRALMLGGVSVGKTVISGLLESDDVLATANAMSKMGVKILKNNKNAWQIHGRGVGGLMKPKNILDLGNSGTGVRLLIGLAGGHNFSAIFTGDQSLNSRPMDRIIDPLGQMGIKFLTHNDKKLPLTVIGPETIIPINYTLPVPSAQVKSAILLAGLNAPGETSIIETEPTRNHTELMLKRFGANIEIEQMPPSYKKITLVGQPELTGQNISVPSDISSAAFPIVACMIVPNSQLTLRNIGVNPLRTGLIKSLKEMGASINIQNPTNKFGEETADIWVQTSQLRGINIPKERAPSMIDEYPILAVAAAFAKGKTSMHGLSELRVKESDRINLMAEGLKKCGVNVDQTADTLIVHGKGSPPLGNTNIETSFDHRIAMSFLIFGMGSQYPISINNADSIDTSFPNFYKLMNEIGGNIDLI